MTLDQLRRADQAAIREAEVAALTDLEDQLVTLHHEDFPAAAPTETVPPVLTNVDALIQRRQKEAARKISIFRHSARKTARKQAHEDAIVEAQQIDAALLNDYHTAQSQAEHEWDQLIAHEPDVVIAALEDAFADNISAATCVDAGIDEGCRYATIIIVFGAATMIPDRTPSITPTGRTTTKKRTKTDRNKLYLMALGSTVLATLKEAFAVAPSLDQVCTAVLQRTPSSAGSVVPIYIASFNRSKTAGLSWKQLDPAEALASADGASLKLKGPTREVVSIGISEDVELTRLVEQFASALKDHTST